MPNNFCIHCTLPRSTCVCDLAPNLVLPSQVSILFHPRELERRNSSGRLLKHCFNIPSENWHRLKNQQLESIYQGYHLLYPEQPSETLDPDRDIKFKHYHTNTAKEGQVKGFLWLDATWQESRKILKQSPWLSALPKHTIPSIAVKDGSQYKLRRNQTETGLSTIESFAYWLYELNQPQSAQDLLNFFNTFQTAYLLARDTGQFK